MKKILRLFKQFLGSALAAAALISTSSAAESVGWVNGITEAINDVVLSSSLPGIVGRRPVKEGDFVKAGDTIIELDKKLEELEEKRRKYVADLRKTDLERTRSLFEKNSVSVSRDEMDKKVAEHAVAALEYDLAREQLIRRQILAPFDGTVTALTLDVGEACQAQQPLARLVDTRRCYFVSNVEAKAGHNLKTGQTVQLEIEVGDQSLKTSGTIYFVSPVVDPASGLMRIKVVFENPDGKVRPGVAGKMLLQENKDA